MPVGCWISNQLFLNSGILDLSEIILQCIFLRNGYYTYILYPYTISINYNRMTGLRLKAKKCRFGLPRIEYVGRVVDKDGLSV